MKKDLSQIEGDFECMYAQNVSGIFSAQEKLRIE